MAKRSATSVLNQDNWDVEEDSEEQGVFQKASSDVLESRVIRTAKRRIRTSDLNSGTKSSPFSGFSGFGKAVSTSSNASSPFSFLSQSKPVKIDENNKNGTEKGDASSPKESSAANKSVLNSFSFSSQTKDSTDMAKSKPADTDSSLKPFEHVFKSSKPSITTDEKNSSSLELLKDLNLSCSKWITEHLEKNPYCILTPIFKDYEKHLLELNLSNESEKGDAEKSESKKLNVSDNSNTETEKVTSVNKDESTDTVQTEKKASAESFKFGTLPQMKPYKFQLDGGNFPGGNLGFQSSSPFSLNQIGAKPEKSDLETKNNDEEQEEPPKNEFVPVVEEDSVFDMKCKVFVKKDGSFVSRGVGTLFLKPVKDSSRTQAVVRAHTSLGNILLNVLLAPGIPVQKTGKNNAMLVCVPTPDSKPPPVPVLIRVKTSEECDRLIKKLEECIGAGS